LNISTLIDFTCRSLIQIKIKAMDIMELENGTLLICKKEDLAVFAESLMNKSRETAPIPEPDNSAEQPISQTEAIKFLGKSRQTFYSWRQKGVIKAHVLGGRVYYFKSELLAAMGKV
jgi:hypothetical protein